jgi:hypothetical protein
MAEKRRAARVHHDSIPELYDETGRLLEENVRLVDVSATGAQIATTATLVKGSTIRGRLRLLKEGVVSFGGRVLWAKEKENFILYGIEFNWIR